MWDGLHVVKQVFDAGATIKVLDFPSLDLPTPEGRVFLAMFSAMAEGERLRIVARTKEGRRLAMTNGVKMGPPFKLTEHQRSCWQSGWRLVRALGRLRAISTSATTQSPGCANIGDSLGPGYGGNFSAMSRHRQ